MIRDGVELVVDDRLDLNNARITAMFILCYGSNLTGIAMLN
jgi:hypothetical protein